MLDLIRDIRDPEKPETLEQLHIVYEEGVKVEPLSKDTCLISIEFTPTIPHCSLATLIGSFSAIFTYHIICCILVLYKNRLE